MYGHTCEQCGANLDPGERCDCHERVAASQKGEERSSDDESSSKEYRKQRTKQAC